MSALMEKFVQFYNKNITDDNLDDEHYTHPFMRSYRILSAFLHYHPFHDDSNGRVGRSLMAL